MYNGHLSHFIRVEQTIYKSQIIPHSYKIIWGFIKFLQQQGICLSYSNINEYMPKLSKSFYHKAIDFFKSKKMIEDKDIIIEQLDNETTKKELSEPKPKAARGRSKLSLTTVELEHIESFPEEQREIVYNDILTTKRQNLSLKKKYIKNNNYILELTFNYESPTNHEIYINNIKKQGLSACPLKNSNRFNRGDNFDIIRKLDIRDNYIKITKEYIETEYENRQFNDIPNAFLQDIFKYFPNIMSSLSKSTQIMFRNKIQETGSVVPLQSWNIEFENQITKFDDVKVACEAILTIIKPPPSFESSIIDNCYYVNKSYV